MKRQKGNILTPENGTVEVYQEGKKVLGPVADIDKEEAKKKKKIKKGA